MLRSLKSLYSSVSSLPFPIAFIQVLKNMPEIQYTRLANGLRVATEERECVNACVGLYIDGGARYEDAGHNGITHFFEHIAFKGTRSRNKVVLDEQMYRSGARFRCFTSREMVCYYAESLSQNSPLALHILVDCVFNNSFSHNFIELGKGTVEQEIAEHDNNVSDVLWDYLHSTAYQGTPLSQTVMGPSGNLNHFNGPSMAKHLKQVFSPDRMVLAAVGGLKHEQHVALADSLMGHMKCSKWHELHKYRYSGSDVRYRDDSMPLANAAIAVEAPSLCHEDKVAMDVAASIVGGWDRSQGGGLHNANRLAQAGATGLCHAFKAFYINYKDTGLWGCRFLGTTLQLEDMLLMIQDQWMHMCNTISDVEVERAKAEQKTKLLSQTQSCVGACHEIGRWTLYTGRRPPLHESIDAVDEVCADQIKAVCTKYLFDKCPVVAAVGPLEALPDYVRIKAGMYWLRI